MKARNAKERAVEDATAQYIRGIGDGREVREAARPKYYVRTPLNRKERGVWCTNCGGIIDYDPDLLINQLNEDRNHVITCPHCGEKLRHANFMSRGVGHRIYRCFNYALKAEAHGDWQVLRYFHVSFEAEIGKRPQMARPIEVVRRWYNVVHGGKAVVWSTGRKISYYGCDFSLDNKLTLKREVRTTYSYNEIHYRVREDAVVPGAQWHRLLRRDGFKGESTMRLLDLDSFDVPVVFSCPQLVTLYKARHYRLVKYYASKASEGLGNIRDDWPSLKVALRHRYRIGDIGMYHDYLSQLRELGEDACSPHWICPDNLRLAHDVTNGRLQRLREAKREDEDKETARKAEKKYAIKIDAFRDLRLTGDGVVIAVIPTVEDVRQEGKHMHHCVFRNRYYDQPASLLLSARDDSGLRLETIEFSLTAGKVLQSRAACNKTSPKHKEILAMMKAAADQIVETWKRSQTKRPKVEIKPVSELVQAFV